MGEEAVAAVGAPRRMTIPVEVLGDEESRIEELSAMLGLGDSEGREAAARLLAVSAAKQ